MRGPIVLLTDFGLADPCVGIMKGVILTRAPRARVVDLAHGIAPQDVAAAALALRASVRYFPRGSLFVTIVDPGVGSRRRVLWARSQDHQFLAPDNGALSWLAAGDAIVERRSVVRGDLFLSPLSSTFHGRDVFAPVAAALARGFPPSRLGPRVEDQVVLPWPKGGRVLSFDRFGNAVTSLEVAALPARARVVHRGRDLGPLRTHYAEVPPGRALAVAGSAGLVELSTRGGDYRAAAGARQGDHVHVRR